MAAEMGPSATLGFAVQPAAHNCYNIYMNKEPLSRTNEHLRDPKKRREMIVHWVIASSAIEGVRKAAESALLSTKRPVHIRKAGPAASVR